MITTGPQVLPIDSAIKREADPCIRPGTMRDAPDLYRLIAANVEASYLLPRQFKEVTAHATRFFVSVAQDSIVGCGELAPLSRTVAEIRSLAVDEPYRGMGLGSGLVRALTQRAWLDGFKTLCAFTHNPSHFVRFGFSIVPHVWFPDKISTDCHACTWFRRCTQYAMLLRLDNLHENEPPSEIFRSSSGP